MDGTVSQSVHAVVQSSRFGPGPLHVHASALEIARRHGIRGNGVWLVEQAIVMVGSRAGIGMKLGSDIVPISPIHVAIEPRRAANSN
jgi:hypothetical protein